MISLTLQASITLTWSQITVLSILLDSAIKEGRVRDCEALAAILKGAELRAIEKLAKPKP